MKGVAHACKTSFSMVQDAAAEVVEHVGRRCLWRCEAANPGVAPGADHAVEKNSEEQHGRGGAIRPVGRGQAWVEPIESGIRDRIRERIEELVEQELASALRRARDERGWHVGSSARLGAAADGLFRAGGEVGAAGAAARAERHGAEAAQRSPA
jgi:hypothetical protein